RLSVAKNAVRNAVSGAAAAARGAMPSSTPPASTSQPSPTAPGREDREIESWLGDLRGGDKPDAAAPQPQPQPLRPSAEP
ncbi:hypothetical protein DKX15_21660, partial [Enterococcus faecium]